MFTKYRRATMWGIATVLAVGAASAGVAVTAAPPGTPEHARSGAVAFGNADDGRIDLPAPPSSTWYVAGAAGGLHSVLLRSDGEVVGLGYAASGQISAPALPSGVRYTAVAAGDWASYALRSDGQLVAFGDDSQGQSDVPALPSGVTYTGVAAGAAHSLALRSDGQVVAFGDDSQGQSEVPVLPSGMTYTTAAAGGDHSLALRSDGTVVAWGTNAHGESQVPALPAGAQVLSLSAGDEHSVVVTDAHDDAVDSRTSISVRRLSIFAGDRASLEVTVTATDLPPGSQPTGSVELREGGTILATATLSGGAARLVLPAALAVGSHALIASYFGSDTVHSSVSAVTTVVVVGAQAGTVTNLSLPRTAKARTAVTARVTVRSSGADVPQGTVRVLDGGKTAATGVLHGGVVSLRLPPSVTSKVAVHRLTAVYAGAGVAEASSSGKVSLRVVKAKAKVKVKGLKVRKGTRPRLTVVVTSTGKVAKGKVTVKRGSTVLARGKVAASSKVRVRLPASVTSERGKVRVKVVCSGTRTVAKKAVTVRLVVR